jgi:hypothetical protein
MFINTDLEFLWLRMREQDSVQMSMDVCASYCHKTMPTVYVSAVVEVCRQGMLLGYVVFGREIAQLVRVGDGSFYGGLS